MEKLPMCRICLVKNARMYVVTDKNLQTIYEKLTDVPFVTEDNRPVLACFFCCNNLKQCGQLQRKCLEAEALFAQMLDHDYEPKPLLNQGQLEFCSRFIITPIVHISILDECQAESVDIKKELPDVCEGQDDIIEPKEEPQSDELELEYQDIEYLDSLTDQEDMISDNSKLEDIPPKKSELEVIPSHQSESDSLIHSEWCDGIFFKPELIPSMEFKTEAEREQEVSKKIRRAKNTERATVVNKSRRAKLEDTIAAEQKKNHPPDSNFIRTVRNRVSKYVPEDKEPATSGNTTVTNCNIDKSKEKLNKPNITDLTNNLSTAIEPNCRRNSKKDILMRKIRKNKGINSDINTLQTSYDDKLLKCDVCPRKFTTKGKLKRHNYVHTGEKPYKCYICQRSFIIKYNLTRHIRTHSGEKPYKCDVCQRSFALKNSCKIHIRTHTGEKPYKCNVCQRSYGHKYSLNCHARLHTGEKPYKCDLCQRFFAVKIHLREHILTHTGEKPYKCDICQHSFIKKYNLKNHIQTHTGEKPYKCDLCERSFALKQYLRNHTRNHNVERPYKCDICQRSFNLKGILDKHILTHW